MVSAETHLSSKGSWRLVRPPHMLHKNRGIVSLKSHMAIEDAPSAVARAAGGRSIPSKCHTSENATARQAESKHTNLQQLVPHVREQHGQLAKRAAAQVAQPAGQQGLQHRPLGCAGPLLLCRSKGREGGHVSRCENGPIKACSTAHLAVLARSSSAPGGSKGKCKWLAVGANASASGGKGLQHGQLLAVLARFSSAPGGGRWAG